MHIRVTIDQPIIKQRDEPVQIVLDKPPGRASCDKCKRPLSACYCDRIQRIHNRWPVHILQTAKEANHPLNTAIMAKLSLSKIHIERIESNHDVERAIETLRTQEPTLVFPSDNGQAITELDRDSPRPLIMIDSTWRKAKRMLHENALLRELPTVFLQGEKRRYALRHAKSHEKNIGGKLSMPYSTIEAIAMSLSYFENDEKKYAPLLELLESVLQTQRKFIPEKTDNS